MPHRASIAQHTDARRQPGSERLRERIGDTDAEASRAASVLRDRLDAYWMWSQLAEGTCLGQQGWWRSPGLQGEAVQGEATCSCPESSRICAAVL